MRNICAAARKVSGLSQADFARAIGVSRQTIVRWESNPESFTSKGMEKILSAPALDMNVRLAALTADTMNAI